MTTSLVDIFNCGGCGGEAQSDGIRLRPPADLDDEIEEESWDESHPWSVAFERKKRRRVPTKTRIPLKLAPTSSSDDWDQLPNLVEQAAKRQSKTHLNTSIATRLAVLGKQQPEVRHQTKKHDKKVEHLSSL